MKAYIVILLSVLLFNFSCKKPDMNVDVIINVKVINLQGQDLLNNPAVYDKNNIQVRHIINGQENLSEGGFEFMDGEAGTKVLLVYPTQPTENISTTLIQFGNSTPDTIKCEFIRSKSSLYCHKVWLNGELKFNDVPRRNAPRVLTFVK